MIPRSVVDFVGPDSPPAPHIKGETMKLSRGAERLFDLLKWYTARFRSVFPKQETLARHLKCSIRTIIRWLGELKSRGAVAVQRCGPQSADYAVSEAFLKQQLAAENVTSLAELCRVSGRATRRVPITEFPPRRKQYMPYRDSFPKPPERERNYIIPGREAAAGAYLAMSQAEREQWLNQNVQSA